MVRDSRVVTQCYFYCHDSPAGPFFLKYCGYFPHAMRRYLRTACRGGGPTRTPSARPVL